MNDEVRKLAVKAGLVQPYGSDRLGLAYFDYRMFAELIIRDVVDTIKRTQKVSPDFEWTILNNYNLELTDETTLTK